MEFASRKLKWYWLLLFLAYCGVVVFELFRANPYLYSQNELRASLSSGKQMELKPFPTPPPQPRELAEITYAPRFGLQNRAVDTLSPARSRNLLLYKFNPIKHAMNVENVSGDASGFYVTGRSNWLVAVDLDGLVRWTFLLEHKRQDDEPIFPILLDANTAYAVHPEGEVTAVNKTSGELIWNLPLKSKVVSTPFLWKEFVALPLLGTINPEEKSSSSRPGVQLALISRTTGEMTRLTPRMDLKVGFATAYNSELNQFILNVDNRVVAIDGESFQVLWSQVLTDPIKGAATLDGSRIYVATLGAKVMALDSARKGRLIWEADLAKPPMSQPTVLPIMDRLSIQDEAGTVYTLDAKTGKIPAKVDFSAQTSLADTWSARIKSNHIEEFKMDWLHKGWTTWLACAKKQLCIVSPKGRLVSQIALNGAPMALPVVGTVGNESSLAFFVQTGENEYAVSQLMDEKQIKALKAKEAAEAVKTD